MRAATFNRPRLCPAPPFSNALKTARIRSPVRHTRIPNQNRIKNIETSNVQKTALKTSSVFIRNVRVRGNGVEIGRTIPSSVSWPTKAFDWSHNSLAEFAAAHG
jgi:hypothetical protein